MEDFDTQFEFSDVISFVYYHLLVSLSRQDCRRTWALLECPEPWTKLVEPQSFVICDLLIGTTSDATPHDTMIFEWCIHTYSTECLCSLWNETGGFYPFCSKTFISLGVVVFYPQYGWFPYRMEDFDTQFELLDVISLVYLVTVYHTLSRSRK